ncbi:hypothetical protein [Aeromicrobium sp. UC242_57]|uniref:hypothetical protein n=1 Tax=Aeromicrobium sp. UC242_57 TaxID=3374624 RepID=UPI0037AD0FB8
MQPSEESKATPATAPPRSDVEVRDAVFIADTSGHALLTAKVTNRTDTELGLLSADLPDQDGLLIMDRSHGPIKGHATTSIGRIDDTYLAAMIEGAEPGTDVTVTLTFEDLATIPAVELPPISLTAPVIARSPDNDDLLGVPPDAITVKDGVIVVVPGQERAYVDGTITSKIDDMTWGLPTAKNAQGKTVAYRHQTSTGGPSGLTARTGEPTRIGGPPYRVPDPEQIGDADYFDAADVTVGETITVTIPFQYGDVIARFKVMAG